jgi:hypothetical protein
MRCPGSSSMRRIRTIHTRIALYIHLKGIFQRRQLESLLYINFSCTSVALYSYSIFNNHIFYSSTSLLTLLSLTTKCAQMVTTPGMLVGTR